MVTIEIFRKIALNFPEVKEAPHFEKTSFKVNKKIFATYDGQNKRACIKLSEIEQDVFCKIDNKIIFPVNNKWGKHGWTQVEMEKVNKKLFLDALKSAYCESAPKKLAEQIRNKENE